MHFKFETKSLDDSLSRMGKVVSAAEYVQFVGKDKKVRVMTSRDGFSVALDLQGAELFSEGKFAVAYSDIKKIFRNRKTVEVKLSDKANKLLFKAGSSKDFSGDLVTVDTHSIKFESGEKGSIRLTEDQILFAAEALKFLAIDDIYFKKPLPLTLHFSENSGYCFVNSDFHVALARTKGSFEKSTLTMPLKNFSSILSLSGDTEFSICVTESSITASSSGFDVSLPLESQESAKVGKTLKIMESIVSMETAATIDMEELKSIMENALAVDDGKRSMLITLSKKGDVNLELTALRGSVKARLDSAKAKCDGTFSVAPQLLSNIIKAAKKGTFSLRMTDRLFSLSNKSDKVSYHYVGTFHE